MALVAEPSLRIVLHHTKLNKYRKEGRGDDGEVRVCYTTEAPTSTFPDATYCGLFCYNPASKYFQMQRIAPHPHLNVFSDATYCGLFCHTNTSPLLHKVNFVVSESWTNLQNVNCNIVPLFNIHSFSLVAEFHPYNMKSKFSNRLLLKRIGIVGIEVTLHNQELVF